MARSERAMGSHSALVMGLCGVALATATMGCARVILEDDASLETSSAGGPGSGGGGPVVTAATGAEGTAVGTGAGGGAGEGGGGGGAPRCASLGWSHEPHGVDQSIEELWERWAVVDGARLVANDDGVHVLQSGRASVLLEEDWQPAAGARSVVWSRVESPWDGRPTMVVDGSLRWSRLAALPWFAAIPRPGDFRWQIAHETPGEPYPVEGYGAASISLVNAHGTHARGPLPGVVQSLRDFVSLPELSPVGERHLAVIAGVDRLVAWVGPRIEPTPIDLGACGDRELAVDVELLGWDPVVAHASAPEGCGAPTEVRLATLDDGAVTVTAAVDLGAPVRALQLLEGAGATWVVARTEGEDHLTVLRMDAARAIDHRFEVPLAADRELTAASWSSGLVLVDTGEGDATTPWIRVRALDREGAVTVESTPPPWTLRPEGRPAALGSSGDDAVLVTFVERTPLGVRHAVVRADCVAE